MYLYRVNRPNAANDQRLSSWPALNAPFDGQFCVVRAHSSVLRHAHREYEILIVMAGEAVVESKNERMTIRRGDIVHFTPFVDHQVINQSDRDFEMFSVLWTHDLCDLFVRRHLGEVTGGAGR